MTRIRLAVLASLMLVLSLFGQNAPPSIDPPDPTSKDPVTLSVQYGASCAPLPVVTRSGFEIFVKISGGLCGAPPTLITDRVELGVLPAGVYNVRIGWSPDDPAPMKLSFVVLDANSSVQVAQSIGPATGGTPVVVTSDSWSCNRAPCALPTITFGGAAATDITQIDRYAFRVTTPPHPAGAVELRFRSDSNSASSYAFRYYDSNAEPSPKWFEKILIPVVYNGPGAQGSTWITELSLRNDNGWPVSPWRAIEGRTVLEPIRPFRFGSGSAPAGMFVMVPRDSAPGMSFHAAVRDTTHAVTDWATEVPVARERDFSTNTIELLDLPSDPRYRITVRIYTLKPPQNRPTFATVGVYSMDDDARDLRRYGVTLIRPADCGDGPDCFDRPAFGSITGIGTGLPYPRIGIRIQPIGIPMWAFATITNNETQHVTVVSPH